MSDGRSPTGGPPSLLFDQWHQHHEPDLHHN